MTDQISIDVKNSPIKDCLLEFIQKLEDISGGPVMIKYDNNGNLNIIYPEYPVPLYNPEPEWKNYTNHEDHLDYDVLFRFEPDSINKINDEIYSSAMQNNYMPDDTSSELSDLRD